MPKNQDDDWGKDRGAVMHRLQYLEDQLSTAQDKLEKLTLKAVMVCGAVGGVPAILALLN